MISRRRSSYVAPCWGSGKIRCSMLMVPACQPGPHRATPDPGAADYRGGMEREDRHPVERPHRVTDVPLAMSERLRIRRRRYLIMMGVCLVLILLAWNVVRFWSTGAAVVMSVVAMFIPPVAALMANRDLGA